MMFDLQDSPIATVLFANSSTMLSNYTYYFAKYQTNFVFVVLQGRGKTTLLATLQGRKPPSENVATVGISVDQWTLQPSTSQGTLARFFSSSVRLPLQYKHLHIYVNRYKYRWICMHMYIFIYILIYIFIYLYTFLCIFLYVYINEHVYIEYIHVRVREISRSVFG